MIPVIVHGAEGRMGRLITEMVEASDDLQLVGLVTEVGRGRSPGEFHPRLPLTPQDRLADVLEPGVVVIDFTSSAALDGLLDGAAAADASLVIGTTGHDEEQLRRLRDYAAAHPVVMASNFSVGIPVLRLLLEKLAEILPPGFMPAQVETHHRHKLDLPSGTARTLAHAWEDRRGEGTVPTHSLRLGGVTGEHTWIFSDDEETLVLTHRAHSRRAFLRGLPSAVRYAAAAGPGLATMEDVLAAGERSETG